MHCYVWYEYIPVVCISICLKSVLRYKFLILGTYHPDTLYLREQGCEDPWLFYEAKRGQTAKYLGNTALNDTDGREVASKENVRSTAQQCVLIDRQSS
jgi:hypothetical protein